MPEAHTRSFPDFQSRRPGPLYAFPLTFIYLFPAVALGVARAAIDAFAEIANRREITRHRARRPARFATQRSLRSTFR
jgi:hypothetical protein